MQKQISNFFSPAQLCLFSLPCFKYFNQNYKWFEPAKEVQTRTWATLQVSGTSLTHLILLVSFYTPWNNKKTIELLMFLESIERAVAFKWVIFRLSRSCLTAMPHPGTAILMHTWHICIDLLPAVQNSLIWTEFLFHLKKRQVKSSWCSWEQITSVSNLMCKCYICG